MNTFAKDRRLFPDPRLAGQDGLVFVGGEVTAKTLFEAYSFGIFPWPQDGLPLLWFCPFKRGILEFEEVHLATSFKKFLRNTKWQVTWNQSFKQVIRKCAEVPRPGQDDTWITPEIERGHLEFHKDGFAHSLECWDGEKLIGGLYGTFVGGVFSGESMFFEKPNASKLCLWRLIERLKECGLTWMDAQMVTPHLKSMGGKYISRREFLLKVELAHKTHGKKEIILPV